MSKSDHFYCYEDAMLLDHLLRNSLKWFSQASRGHQSTETALVKVTNALLRASVIRLVPILVLMDLAAMAQLILASYRL